MKISILGTRRHIKQSRELIEFFSVLGQYLRELESLHIYLDDSTREYTDPLYCQNPQGWSISENRHVVAKKSLIEIVQIEARERFEQGSLRRSVVDDGG